MSFDAFKVFTDISKFIMISHTYSNFIDLSLFFLKVHAIPISTDDTPPETPDTEQVEDLGAEETSTSQEILTKVKVTTPPQQEEEEVEEKEATTESPMTSEEEVDEQEKSTEESPSDDDDSVENPNNSAHHHHCQHLMAFVPVLLIALSLKF